MEKVFDITKEKHRIFLRGNQKNRRNESPGQKYTDMETEKDNLQKVGGCAYLTTGKALKMY